MKSAIVAPELHGLDHVSQVGTFVDQFSRLLSANAHPHDIIYTGRYLNPDNKTALEPYRQRGVNILRAIETPLSYMSNHLHDWYVRRSEIVTEVMPKDTGVVYFQDWLGNGFHTVRTRQYTSHRKPAVVTVMHGPSILHREGKLQYPVNGRDELALDFTERYTAQHSDFVVAPSQYLLDWAQAHGWKLPPAERVRVLRYPWMVENDDELLGSGPHHRYFKRLVFFGSVLANHDTQLFVESVLSVAKKFPNSMRSIEEIVIMGNDLTAEVYLNDAINDQLNLLREHFPVRIIATTTHERAHAVLRGYAGHALFVVPNITEIMDYSVIQCMLTENCDFICSNVGGLNEILTGGEQNRLFEPYLRSLSGTLREFLDRRPMNRTPDQFYDYRAANQDWLSFHEEATAYAEDLASKPRPFQGIKVEDGPSVDVVIPYFNHGQYLPQALLSLELQTFDDFNVIVMNDGSTDEYAIYVFNQMKRKYHNRGWRFITQENSYLGATRNAAVALGSAPYLCFLDADDVAYPQMLERFYEAMGYSDADSLSAPKTVFTSEDFPFDPETGDPVVEVFSVTHPLGAALELATLAFATISTPTKFIKRTVFEAMGGYTTDRAGFEDNEFASMLVHSGYKVDVVPEYLYYYRTLPEGMARTMSWYTAWERVARVHRRELNRYRLGQLPLMMRALHEYNEKVTQGFDPEMEVERNEARNEPEWIANYVPWRTLAKGMQIKARKLPDKLQKRILKK